MPQQLARNVLSWASQLDERAAAQASAAAAMPFVAGHLALMPDAHVGKGATIGSVIPTRGAIMPAAVGVDIGCGMSAAETVLTAADLPDDLGPLLSRLERLVPPTAGQGRDHEGAGERWLGVHGLPRTKLSGAQERKTIAQFATLGSGNHFWELCLDERDRVWIMLHSGSRGIGNVLAQQHIQRAKGLMATWFVSLPDPDLAYLVEGTPEFDHYIADLLWAQSYAAGSRARMTEVGLAALADAVGRPGATIATRVIDCHHNYTTRERHRGADLWITRKGAILAREGVLGIIPGSMGTRSYIVRGLGNSASYHSCAHGAGRAMSRNEARRRYTAADLAAAMGDRTWLADRGEALVDEIPAAYKDIDAVMEDQRDLVEALHTLRQILNYKGT